MNKNRFTLMELLIVVAILGILVTLLLPSLSRAREKARFAVCTSNRSQQYLLVSQGLKDHNGHLPQFRYVWVRYNNQNNPNNPEYAYHDWMGAAGQKKQANKGIINPVAGHYSGNDDWNTNPNEKHPLSETMRCPSINDFSPNPYNAEWKNKITATEGSNGFFDYGFLQTLGGMFIHKLDTSVSWYGRSMETPLIVEEDPRYNMGWGQFYQETSHGNGDILGQWHDTGTKGAYTSLNGSNVIVRRQSFLYKSNEMYMYYSGMNILMGSHSSLEQFNKQWRYGRQQ